MPNGYGARPKPAILAGIALVVTLHLLAALSAAQSGPTLQGCPVFRQDNIWNTRIDGLPVHPNSTDFITTIGAGRGLHPDFGSGTWQGAPIGIPFTVVDASQTPVGIAFDYADESDPGPYPIPPDALIEGGSQSAGDRHVLVLDRDSCTLYELFAAYPQQDGSWRAGSGAVFDLTSNELRPDGWTSADAAGLPILPGLVRYDEVELGTIRHALRFTAPQTRGEYVWPARHEASSQTGTQYPPMGQRFRLKAGYDIARFSTPVRVILQAMKTYGLILADNGSAWYVSGAPDARWNNDTLVSELAQVKGSDFEAVDASSLMVDPDSAVVAQSGAGGGSSGGGTNTAATAGGGGGGGCFLESVQRPVIGYTNSPAQCPEAHAHCRLNPPSQPVTSRTSPTK